MTDDDDDGGGDDRGASNNTQRYNYCISYFGNRMANVIVYLGQR